MLPISLSKQILPGRNPSDFCSVCVPPGTFEYTLNYLIDKKLDLSIFNKKYMSKAKINYTLKMKEQFDSAYGRSLYSKRMGTVEPVFGHIAGTKKLNRFTLRSKKKVNNQWLLYCTVHNIGKIQKYGKL